MAAGKRNLLARCVIMAGSPTGAVLLYRICYWHPYKKVEADGHTWVAKTRMEWAEETGLSLEQYKAAVRCLVQKNLVLVQQRKYGTRTISFIRLSQRGEEVMTGNLPKSGTGAVESNDTAQVEPNDTTGEVENTPPGWGQTPPPYIMGDTGIGDTVTEVLQGAAQSCTDESGTLDSEASPGYKPSGKEAAMVTIKDLQANGGKLGKPKSLSAEVKKAKLEKVWLSAVADLTGKFAPPLTAKDKGQLGLFEKQCGETAAAILSHVIENWNGFVEAVKSSAGLFTVPSQPKIGFILSHAAAAVMFCQKGPDTSHVPEIKIAPPKEPAPTGKTKMTYEEVLKALEDDDAG